MSVHRYGDADAFRRSLEQRIATAAKESGLPHDRLRKAVGFHRLVARFLSVQDRRWAIKGGAGLLWRVGHDVRATKDVDANWAGDATDLNDFLDSAVSDGVDDWFSVEIGAPRTLQGETGNAFRYAVSVRLAGREFTAFRLDVNLSTEMHAIETVAVHLPLLQFVDLADLAVPMISIAQQIAEKLHALQRSYSTGAPSRAKDLYDSLLLAQTIGLPSAGTVKEAAVVTFTVRDTPLPTEPHGIPQAWSEELDALLAGYAIPGLGSAADLVWGWRRLWVPVLSGGCPDSATWHSAAVSWV